MSEVNSPRGKIPEISILTPVRNGLPFLLDCKVSVLAQSKEDWEWIIVDDNSEDDTWSLVELWAQQEKKIKAYRNRGKGIIPALRLALEQSQGEKITRMDADDLMTEQKLELLSTLLNTYGTGHVSMGQVKYFGTDKMLEQGYKNYELWLNELICTGENFKDVYKECVIPSPNWMMYRQDLIKVGAFNSESYPEDYDLVFRIYKAGLQCIPCHEVTHLWRDHHSRASRNDPNYADNLFLAMKIKYFLELDASDDQICLIGGGDKGKWLAKELIRKNKSFNWFTNNPNKIDQDIYGQVLKDQNLLEQMNTVKIIVAVSNKEDQAEIERQLLSQGRRKGLDYFYFC